MEMRKRVGKRTEDEDSAHLPGPVAKKTKEKETTDFVVDDVVVVTNADIVEAELFHFFFPQKLPKDCQNPVFGCQTCQLPLFFRLPKGPKISACGANTYFRDFFHWQRGRRKHSFFGKRTIIPLFLSPIFCNSEASIK